MSGAPPERPPAFVARGLRKRYPGVEALRGLNLEGYPGEVLAICGANGAGKSTFSRLLSAQEPPSAGTIQVAGHDGALADPADAERAGVLMLHQEPLIIDDLGIGENVWLSRLRSGRGVRPWQRPRVGSREETRAVLRRVGLGAYPLDLPAGRLAPGQRQMLALSRSLVTDHQILILDETTASTTEDHFETVLEMVAAERAAGTCVVFVSHRLQEVLAIADRVAVLRNSELVTVLRTSETDAEEITRAMIGDAVRAMHRPPATMEAGGAPLLRVRGLASGSARDISFDVQPGEIVGLYGLVGSGRSSVARAVTGQQARSAGTVNVAGREVTASSPASALRHRLAYLSEDRRREGFVADFDNRENLSLVTLPGLARRGWIDRRRERERTRSLIERFQIKGGPGGLTRNLSGGNQQKVCLAKWVEADPRVVVLDEPTKGIDVGARANIYEIIYGLAEQGRAILVVSSEAEEVLLLSHRVLVMRDGALVGEFDAADTGTEDLIGSALGGGER